VFSGSSSIFQITSNFKSFSSISQKKSSILSSSEIIFFTSDSSLFFKLSSDKAQRVKYFISYFIASFAIFLIFSAHF
jgi:hypothetical protein